MKAGAMIMAMGLFVLAWHGGAIAQAGIDPIRLDRALANYRALRDGTKQVGQLTQQELIDVDALDRQLRGEKRDARSLSQRCVDDELRRAGGSASALARRVIDMKCREAGD